MFARLSVIFTGAMLAATGATSAQEPLVWTTIDCAASHLAPVEGTACLSTDVVSGGIAAGGRGQRHMLRGTTALGSVVVVMSEALDDLAYVMTLKNTVDFLKLLDRRAADASAWSDAAFHGTAEYFTFRSGDGDRCVGLRRLGANRSLGYAWMIHAILCAASGQALQPGQIVQFIDSVRRP